MTEKKGMSPVTPGLTTISVDRESREAIKDLEQYPDEPTWKIVRRVLGLKEKKQ